MWPFKGFLEKSSNQHLYKQAMSYTLDDIDITRLVMQIRKMRAAIAAIINDDKQKVINAKKIFYDRTLLDENNQKQMIENDFYFYLDD